MKLVRQMYSSTAGKYFGYNTVIVFTFVFSSGPRTAASGISDSTSERSCVMRHLRSSDSEEVVISSIDSVHNFFVLVKLIHFCSK